MSLYRVAGSIRGRVAAPKAKYVRSAELMRAYRTVACQACGLDDGTICGAHSNWAVHGKGRGIKASDQYVASLCARCHAMLDSGSQLSESERRDIWWRAHVRTVRLLVEFKRWPHDVPKPDIWAEPWI